MTRLFCYAALAACLLPAVPARAQDCDELDFSASSVKTNAALFDLRIVDVNGDGQQDLALFGSQLFVALGDGAGNFGAPAAYNVGDGGGLALVTADFNGDGFPDVAVCNYHNVSVALNNGQGGFLPPTFLTVGDEPLGITAADLNQDGRIDLAVANFATGNVSILLGNGLGGFAPALTFPSGNGPSGLVAGDFDGDGKLDLAVSEYSSMDLRIFKGSGDGHFVAGAIYPVGTNAEAVVSADFNGDGRPDLALNAINISPSHVAVFLGQGGDTFVLASTVLTPGFLGLAAGDLNGDGHVDLAVPGNFGVEYALGDGTGNFGPAQVIPLHPGSDAFRLAIGDLDGRGHLDIATANRNSLRSTVLLNLPKVSISASSQQPVEGGKRGRFFVSRDGCATDPLTLRYSVSGSATPGQDYQPLSGSVTIPAGQETAAIVILPIDDTIVESPESVILTILPDNAYLIGARSSALLLIEDND